jgi:hypothetical protein
MGDRANYVIVQNGRWDLYYSHWGAIALHVDLLAGPAAATRFIHAQRMVTPDANGWLDDVWCEGAALVDHDRHRLCFFTCHHDGHDDRAAILTVLAHTWPGWQVDWAYGGLADLVTYVGQDTAIVRARPDPEVTPMAADNTQVSCLVTVPDDDGRPRAYALDWDAAEVIEAGPPVLEKLPTDALRTRCAVIPESGVHLDPTTRTAGVWTVRSLGGSLDLLELLWPGWHWEMWNDRREEQLSRTSERFAGPEPDLTSALNALRERFLRLPEQNPVKAAQGLLTRMKSEDPSTVASPHLFDHAPTPPTDAERTTVLKTIADLVASTP